jgi:hypothetical protein
MPPLQRGELVEVRMPADIPATLDDAGTVGNLPFMPEMAAFCGQRFIAVTARAAVEEPMRKLGLVPAVPLAGTRACQRAATGAPQSATRRARGGGSARVRCIRTGANAGCSAPDDGREFRRQSG